MSWTKQPVYVMDFEGNRKCGIIEYGVARLEGGEVTDCWTRICRARERFPQAEADVHGLSFEKTLTQEPFSEEFAFFRDCRRSGPFVAHHASVERNLLRAVWAYPPASPLFHASGTVADWGPWLDTLVIYKTLFPQLESGRLAGLVELFGLQGELNALARKFCPGDRVGYHCALYDALASALLLLQLERFEVLKEVTLLDLFTWSGVKKEANQIEFF